MVLSVNDGDQIKNRNKKIYACPKCKAERNFRVRRSYFVRTFLFWLPLKRYTCYNCKNKYYVFN